MAPFSISLPRDFMPPLFPGGSAVKNLPAMQEMQVRSLAQEDSLEKEMATHFSLLVWRIPWTEEPGGLPSMQLQRATEHAHRHRLKPGSSSFRIELSFCHTHSFRKKFFSVDFQWYQRPQIWGQFWVGDVLLNKDIQATPKIRSLLLHRRRNVLTPNG